jgi:pentatricopeptide repeat protein
VAQYERAREQAQITVDLFPAALHALYVLGWCELVFSRIDSAIESFERAAAISADPITLGYLGHAYARAGRLDRAISLLDELHARIERGYVPAKSFISLHAGLGDRDRVIEWLEKAYRARDPMLFFMQEAHFYGPLAELVQTWTRERLPQL